MGFQNEVSDAVGEKIRLKQAFEEKSEKLHLIMSENETLKEKLKEYDDNMQRLVKEVKILNKHKELADLKVAESDKAKTELQ